MIAEIEKERKSILSSGNSEIDKKLGGGIPIGSLTLIEGENDTGKSVLSQQFTYGGLHQGHSVAYYTTENTIKSLLKQMESLSLDVSEFYAWGYLRVFPIHFEGVEWTHDQMKRILSLVANHIKTARENVVIIDSLTMFTTYSTEDDILEFLTRLKNFCDKGKTILITLHQHAFKEDTLVRIRSACDCHLFLRKEQVGDRYVNVIEVAKVRGARKTTGNIVSFQVRPGFGLKIMPLSEARA
ncbi:putative ATPases involved in biogenesis of archaeal flagella [Archaeoglobus sulfaticallidus PM70-1]|uniref:Putative ATPases involved in biogenesis of archaeal flagella n=1 Tax=Archaeoglobus sulfaticallidus PM70-1 TaxID=387631 RepID=N0BK27_9EURY|nr:ATPase domain-containing protein [Archaeoglobus sulfaticallidus]AGK60856.1 putative ATPases involved in biogenesis of archaeal flagella [Archaeoglobus sulfaticallidus PM70-1]